MRSGPVTGGCARMSQTLRLGFGVLCLFPNLVVPTFSQMAVTLSFTLKKASWPSGKSVC